MQVAIITAQGIGDGLIMMIISYHLKKLGHQVTIFNKHLFSFHNWFEGYQIKYPFDIKSIHDFDIVILQHDNTDLSKEITKLRKEKKFNNLYILYTNYRFKKHGVIDFKYDYAFDQRKSMISNILNALKALFFIDHPSKENGLNIPKNLIFQKYSKRILIHPTSADENKNWLVSSFVKLGKLLQKHDFEPIFIMSAQERDSWTFVEKMGFSLPKLNSLSDLAALIYESKALIGNDSGPAHLASNLQILSIVIAKRKQHMDFWAPDWKSGVVILPPKLIPNIKYLRVKEKYWKTFIRPKRVFKKLIKTIQN